MLPTAVGAAPVETEVAPVAVVETWLPEVPVAAREVVVTVPLELAELDELTVARVVDDLTADEVLVEVVLAELDELLDDLPPLTTLMLCHVPLRSEYWYSVASVAPWPPM